MQRRKWLNKLDYFFVTRPMLFFPGWNTLLAGYLNSIEEMTPLREFADGRYNFHFWDFHVWLVMLAFTAAMGGSFILNQLADVESDRKNKKLFIIDENFVTRKSALLESIILIAASILIGIFIGYRIFFLLVLFVVITALFYNFRPFQWKNTPVGGLIANSLMGWIAFAVGWSFQQSFSIQLIVASFPYVLLNTGLYLLTTIPDMEGDQHTNKRTISVVLGLKSTIVLACFLYIASLISALLLNDQLILLINLFLLYYFIKLVRWPESDKAIQFIKMAIFFFSVMIFLKFPSYILVMVSIFFLTKYYYRWRFNFDYPNFKGE